MRRAKVLIFQDKQRENVENAGRVNKRRKEFTAKQSPSTVVRLIYRKTFAAVTCEDPAGRAVVSISSTRPCCSWKSRNYRNTKTAM